MGVEEEAEEAVEEAEGEAEGVAVEEAAVAVVSPRHKPPSRERAQRTVRRRRRVPALSPDVGRKIARPDDGAAHPRVLNARTRTEPGTDLVRVAWPDRTVETTAKFSGRAAVEGLDEHVAATGAAPIHNEVVETDVVAAAHLDPVEMAAPT